MCVMIFSMGQKLALLCLTVLAAAGAFASPPAYRLTQDWHMAGNDSIKSAWIRNVNGIGEISYYAWYVGPESLSGVLSQSGNMVLSGKFGANANDAFRVAKNSKGAYAILGTNWQNNFYRSIDSPGEAVTPYGFFDEYDCRGFTDSGWMWGSSSDSHDADHEGAHAYNIYTGKHAIVQSGRAHIEGMSESGDFIMLDGSDLWPEDPARSGFFYHDRAITKLPWALTSVKFNSNGDYVGQKSHEPGLFHPVYDVVVGRGATGSVVFQNALPRGIADDMRIAITKFDQDNVGHQSNFRSGVLTDGEFYDYHSITQGLPAGMEIQDHWMRSTGEVAAIGKLGGDFYVLRLTSVPEPASLVALATGALALCARRRTRQSTAATSNSLQSSSNAE